MTEELHTENGVILDDGRYIMPPCSGVVLDSINSRLRWHLKYGRIQVHDNGTWDYIHRQE
jgi:hypothetical protein